MKKLTKEDILSFPITSFGRSIGKQLASQVVHELLGYKQLEEELGCSLEVVVKALKNGVYVLDEETGGTKLILRGFINSTQDYEDGTFGFIDDRYWAMKKLEVTGLCVPIYYAWKDYKKTWWLKEDKSE
jgi:hypothetical protein